ncbi:hypothetical protein NKR23_g3514 [Pleurostoma richardsiae]|uniref:Uncharacterized protein n=1 Tax=Pleurostoma richardsiae TaxID=41990 RepID=A0AA38RYK1_9PEZI|nr:hypothetical protein NKR23_g3514 [Pleurostoma richardsiae]
MVVSLDSLGQDSFRKPLGPWRCQDDTLEGGEVDITAAALLPAIETLKDQISSRKVFLVAKTAAKSLPSALTSSMSPPKQISQPGNGHSSPKESSARSIPTTPSSTHASTSNYAPSSPSPLSSLSLTQGLLDSEDEFSFATSSEESTPPRPSLKRRRPLTDVDGPNSSSFGCKKRRLRLELITSRLSQPFSLPASHILNREAVAVGDKRFLKLAAIVAARKLTAGFASLSIASSSQSGAPHPTQHHPVQSDMLRRAAVLNRFRLHVREAAEQRGDTSVVEVAASAALLAHSNTGLHGLGFVANARMPNIPSPGEQASVSTVPPATPALRLLPPALVHPPYPHPLSRAAAVARASPPSSPSKGPARAGADQASQRPSLSPNLRPVRSPELRASRGQGQLRRSLSELDNEEEEGMSFPTSEHESRYEATDEPDDVYADFSVIFGGGAGDGESSDEDEFYGGYAGGADTEGLDDVLDDLDGIPPNAR